jgi:hypothetical protein
LLEALSDLRKERLSFQKKAIPEIAMALKEGQIPDEQASEWLTMITQVYHQDVTLAQKMIAVDVDEIDTDLFQKIKAQLDHDLQKVIAAELLKATRNDEQDEQEDSESEDSEQ